MEEQKEIKSRKKSNHLRMLSNAVSLSVPNVALARLYRSKVARSENTNAEKLIRHCLFCGNIYSPETCKMRLIPKMKESPQKIYRLLTRIKSNGDQSVGKLQRNMATMYKRSCTRMLMQCLVCDKQQIIHGPSREQQFRERASRPTTPSQTETPTTLSKKEKMKEKKRKKKQKQKRAEQQRNFSGNLDLMTDSILSSSVVTDSGLDLSSQTWSSPFVCNTSTPKYTQGSSKVAEFTSRLHTPVSLKDPHNLGNPTTPSVVSIRGKSDRKNSSKSPMQSLFETPDRASDSQFGNSMKKKKKSAKMHLQLQRVLKKEKNHEKKTLQDFLSSV